MTFAIFGASAWTAGRSRLEGFLGASIVGTCQGCQRPVAGLVKSIRERDTYPDFPNRVAKLIEVAADMDALDLKLMQTWPGLPQSALPPHLPPAIEKSLAQAEDNFKRHGNEDAAAMMYRRALELALKHVAPDAKGTLATKITKLVEAGALPRSIGDWAHEVRLVGNDGAHEETGVDREDLDQVRAFADSTLRYLISLPKTVEERRAQRLIDGVLG